LRALLLALLLLSGCGGGGSSSGAPAAPPPAVHHFDDFFPLFDHTGTATVVDRATGLPLVTYSFTPGVAKWGDNWELWGITSCTVAGAPQQWVVLLAFMHPGGPQWPIVSQRTTWDGADVVCDRGAPYGPQDLAPGVHTLRQWGIVNGTNEFYWQAEYTFGQEAMNPCWTGPQPQRPVIWQREVWQDRGGGTARGTVIGDPWQVVPQVVYDTRNAAGLGAGFLWVYFTPTGQYCLRSLTLT
jgi:hypothetical protein